jgi:hypothetical protein
VSSTAPRRTEERSENVAYVSGHLRRSQHTLGHRSDHGVGWELRAPRPSHGKPQPERKTRVPRPTTFASPGSTPSHRSGCGVDLGAGSTPGPGRTGDGYLDQLPRSCFASPGSTPSHRSGCGVDLGAGSTPGPGRTGDGYPDQLPRSCFASPGSTPSHRSGCGVDLDTGTTSNLRTSR